MNGTREKNRRATSFGKVVESYDRARPTYPGGAVDWLLPTGARSVLDLGAGTGKLTIALVARGLAVTAVDPSTEMLARLRTNLPNVDAVVGTAESLPVADAAFDAIVVGQAWHWIDPVRAAPELARVLRPGGTLGLVWNVRDATSPLVRRLNHILEAGDTIVDYIETARIGAPFAPLQRHDLAWTYALDEATLMDLAASRSCCILMAENGRRDMRAALSTLFVESASTSAITGTRRLVLPYVTHCFRTCLPD